MTATLADPATVQRMDALKHANDIRIRRAKLKRDVKAGRADAVAVILDPPAEALSMRALELLMALPRVGRTKAQRRLMLAGMSTVTRLGEMTDRQRSVLADGLRRYRL